MHTFLERFIYPFARLERWIFPLAFAAGLIGVIYWYWTTTPSYALSSVIDALKHHDTRTFERYVDVDSIASHAFDDFLDGPARDELLNNRNSLVGVGFLRFMKPSIIGIARERIASFIGDPNVSVDNVSDVTTENLRDHKIPVKVRQILIDYGLTKQGFRGIKYLDIDGSKASLGLEFHSPMLNADYVIAFKMEDAGGYWRVTELSNLNELITRYLETRSRA